MSSKRSQKLTRSTRSRIHSRTATLVVPTLGDIGVSRLLRLPVEMIHHILAYLDARDILICTRACRHLQDIVKESPLLQYTIELFHDHLTPNPNIQASHAVLLQRLLQSRHAWDRLNPTSTETVEVDGVSVYEIREGLWISGKSPVAGSDAIRAIVLVELPASAPLKNRIEKTVMDLEFDVADVTVQPSQDLLVILQDQPGGPGPKVHFRMLSDNRPHPAAVRPVLESPYRNELLTLVLSGDNVVISNFPEEEFGRSPGAVIWWNWKRGTLIRDYPHGASAVFLSPDHLAIIVYEEGELALHIISSDQDPFNKEPLCRLHFPPCAGKTLFPYAFSSDMPPPFMSVYPSSIISRDRPVAISSTSDLIAVQLCAQGTQDYLIFLRRSTLLERVINLRKVNRGRMDFLWEQWGPEISRWIEAPDLSTYEGCIHGLRFVTQARRQFAQEQWGCLLQQVEDKDKVVDIDAPKPQDLPQRTGSRASTPEKNDVQLFMLDFNPHPIARGAQSFSDEHCDHYVIQEETVVKGWTDSEIVSRMPFRAVVSKSDRDFGWADAVVEGECIVGIEMGLDEDSQQDRELIDRIRIMTF